jgi:hypothetical protein
LQQACKWFAKNYGVAAAFPVEEKLPVVKAQGRGAGAASSKGARKRAVKKKE